MFSFLGKRASCGVKKFCSISTQQSALTVTALSASFSKKQGSMIPDADIAHHTVTFGNGETFREVIEGQPGPMAEVLLVYKSTYMKMCFFTHPNVIHPVFVFSDQVQHFLTKAYSCPIIASIQSLNDLDLVRVVVKIVVKNSSHGPGSYSKSGCMSHGRSAWTSLKHLSNPLNVLWSLHSFLTATSFFQMLIHSPQSCLQVCLLRGLMEPVGYA